MKFTWLMINSDRTLWATRGFYTEVEANAFQCAKPIEPLLAEYDEETNTDS